MKKKITLIATAIILIGAIVICAVKASGSNISDNMTSANSQNKLYAEKDQNLSYSESALSSNPAGNFEVVTDAAGDTAAENGSLSADRKLIKTIDISAETLEFDKALEAIKSEIEKYGGYIESSDITGNSYDEENFRSACFTVRIPADKTDAFTSGIGNLCNVIRKSESMRDETENYLDTESHLKALRAEEKSLLALLEKAKSVENIVSLQSRLTDVIYQIESYESSLKKIDDLVSFSTVNIDICEVERETPVVTKERTWGEKMADSFKQGLSDMGDSIKNFSVVFMGMIPKLIVFAVIVAVLAVVLSVILKKFKKNKSAKRLEKSASSEETAATYTDSDGMNE